MVTIYPMSRAELERRIADARLLRVRTLASGAAWVAAGRVFAEAFGSPTFIRLAGARLGLSRRGRIAAVEQPIAHAVAQPVVGAPPTGPAATP